MSLSISYTGIRDGEFITSMPSSKQNQGCIMEVKGFYPPLAYSVNKMNMTHYRDGLSIIPFFKNMTVDERIRWIRANVVDKKRLYLESVDVEVRFVRLSGEFFLNLSEEDRNLLSDSSLWFPIRKVFEMFPKKTLIFRPGNWRIYIPNAGVEEFKGLQINLSTLEVKNGEWKSSKDEIQRVINADHTKIPGIKDFLLHGSNSFPLKWENLVEMGGLYGIGMNRVKPIIEWFTPSVHKSLIQKIIRTRCDIVTWGDEKFMAGEVLLASISMLMLSSSYIQNIHRTVFGLESAPKRIAVSINEDSYVENPELLTSMYSSSLMSQRAPEYFPSRKIIEGWFVTALKAQSEPRIFDYLCYTNQELTFSKLGYDVINYMLLSELRSFETDITMLGTTAMRDSRPRVYSDPKERSEMPIIHCIDHHSHPIFAHYYPFEYSTIPYPELFSMVWKEVVGYNPRKEKYINWSIDTEFGRATREAQRLFWLSKTVKHEERKTGDEYVEYPFKIQKEWLAGLIGPIKVKVKRVEIYVVMRPDNIQTLIPIRKPSRGKMNPLSEIERKTAIELAQSKLAMGIKLKKVPKGLPQLKGLTLYLDENDEYKLKRENGAFVEWDEIAEGTIKFPVHQPLPGGLSIENAIRWTGNGVQLNADVELDRLLKSTAPVIIQRLLMYLRSAKSKINLYRPTREGVGQTYSVSPADTGVNHILCSLCVAYPGALIKSNNGFMVKSWPLFQYIRNKILNTSAVIEMKSEWKTPVPDERKLAQHQKEAIEEMLTKHRSGRRGHLIWITTGLGKTLILIRYMYELILINKMPRYCVYTVPAGAIDNIKREFDLYQIPHQTLDMRKTKKGNKKLRAGMVNLIYHDHLRMGDIADQIRRVSSELLFVIDEFHKTLNQSIRTSLALELAKISHDFVGMSGTIIKDSNYKDLSQWLEQVVEFEVTSENFWVAIGALISKKITTNVVVDRQSIEVPIDNIEEYKRYIPTTIGGISDVFNFQEASKICYRSVTPYIIEYANNYIQSGYPVFIVAKDIAHQKEIESGLRSKGVQHIHLIGMHNPITLLPGDPNPTQAVITTGKHSMGYTLTKIPIMISSVYPSNQATRTQLIARLNRVGQPSPNILDIVFHCGILSNILIRYDKAKSFAEAVKDFAKEVKTQIIQ